MACPCSHCLVSVLEGGTLIGRRAAGPSEAPTRGACSVLCAGGAHGEARKGRTEQGGREEARVEEQWAWRRDV